MSVRRAGPDDLLLLASLHAEAFQPGWSAGEIASLEALALLEAPHGMILVRIVAGEAEILTLAVRPGSRRLGVGGRLVRAGIEAAEVQGAGTVFLEVAEDNAPARGLYVSQGFLEVGRRPGYYPRPGAKAADALILRRTLNTGP
ncbi:MAG: GNAT family N-acetyltransferase [Phenylobacterium sp.]